MERDHLTLSIYLYHMNQSHLSDQVIKIYWSNRESSHVMETEHLETVLLDSGTDCQLMLETQKPPVHSKVALRHCSSRELSHSICNVYDIFLNLYYCSLYMYINYSKVEVFVLCIINYHLRLCEVSYILVL